jgi:hypothetical protein
VRARDPEWRSAARREAEELELKIKRLRSRRASKSSKTLEDIAALAELVALATRRPIQITTVVPTELEANLLPDVRGPG